MTEKTKITIDDKDYVFENLPIIVKNAIVARQEIQQSKARHETELEKIAVLTEHYNKKIKEELEKINGSNSESKD